jgi:hypothetical protein
MKRKQHAITPPTAEDRLRAALEAKGPLSQSWAPIIAPAMAQMCRTRKFAISDALDWIDETNEPADIFEFSELTRGRRNVVSMSNRGATG